MEEICGKKRKRRDSTHSLDTSDVAMKQESDQEMSLPVEKKEKKDKKKKRKKEKEEKDSTMTEEGVSGVNTSIISNM